MAVNLSHPKGTVTPDLLIWNLDGPIVDTRESYPSAIRRTVQTYFSLFLNIQGAGSLVQLADVQAFRLAGGFHDSVDLSAALIRYLLSLLPGQFPSNRAPRGIEEAISFLRKASASLQKLPADFLAERADFQATAEAVRQAGGGRQGLARVVRGGWSHPLLMDEGEGDLVRQLFQEIYLGRKHFARLERAQPRFHKGPGQVENETLLSDIGTFERLHGRYRGRMALVTNRSLAEAQLVLRQHNIEKLFDTVVAHEEIVSEEARLRRLGQAEALEPPHPFTVLEAAARLDPDGARSAVVIGDTPDEMVAATRAAATGGRPVAGWGLVTSSLERDALQVRLAEAGAVAVFDSVADLVNRLLAERETP
jgi:HAD superfamily phosphatase